MKLPNGYGGVSKLSGKRRCPWRVRVTDKFEYDPIKDKMVQKYKTLGYYESKAKALQALADYNAHPYDIDQDSITFAELYAKWSSEYFETIVPSAKRTVISAYSYCSILYDVRMKDLRVYHLKKTIEEGYVLDKNGKQKHPTANIKGRIKSMFNLMFDYAAERDIVDKNYARLFSLDKSVEAEKQRNKKDTNPFSAEEEKLLWNNIDFGYTDMLLIDIYSGWRPKEMCILKLDDIDLKNNTMVGGLKTEAGKNRIVPIHPKIKPLIEKRYKESIEAGKPYLFIDEDGEPMTYDKYRRRFEKVLVFNNIKHRPHECRHTFITKAKACGVDEYCLKLIVGHAIVDITENIYTHRTVEQLKEEMNKIV